MDVTPLTGTAAGVPYVAVPPEGGARPDAPVVLAWHLMDPPRTERAFAAALPLAGLDAWRLYLGLPMTGARLPEGGMEAVMALGFEDAVLNLYGPIASAAVEELSPALGELRSRLDLSGPVGLMGGSMGAAVAGLVLAETDLAVRACVLVSPLVQLRPLVDAISEQYGTTYAWSEPSLAVARRLDLVARAGELGGVPVLVAVGEQDDAVAVLAPARSLESALERAELVVVPGMAHALAEEPGTEPAPQTAAAAEVDRLAVSWFRRHLTG